MRLNPNEATLLAMTHELGELTEELVFVGGAIVGLLVDDPAAAPVRATRDVDVLLQVASTAEYYQMAEHLRARGFAECQAPDAPICRWQKNGLLLDVMPTDSNVLGFSNRWYPAAYESASPLTLSNGKSIRLIRAPYFLATKLEAFADRGNGDYLMSHDLEDVTVLLDGCSTVIEQVMATDDELKQYLAENMEQLLKHAAFRAALPSLLLPDAASQRRQPVILQRMRQIAQLKQQANI